MLLLIGLSIAVQVLLYILFRRQKYIRLLVLLLFLFFNLYLFPYLYSENMYRGELKEARCGMAAVGIFFFSWLIGGGLTLLTHICYWLITWKPSLKQKANGQTI